MRCGQLSWPVALPHIAGIGRPAAVQRMALIAWPSADVASGEQVVVVKVRELVRELEREGWVQIRQVGSHRQFRHPTKPGTVTVPGSRGDELAKGTVGSVVRQAGLPRRQR